MTDKHESDVYGYDLNCIYLKNNRILLNPFACTKTKWSKSNSELIIDYSHDDTKHKHQRCHDAG